MPEREIMLGDEVKNTNGNDITGFVIAKYTIPAQFPLHGTYADISTGYRVYYDSPIEHWQTIRAVEDIE